MYSVLFLIVSFIVFKAEIIIFLVNYHIYIIYLAILLLLVYINYIFLYKYNYIFLFTYIYFYWAVYMNIIYINIYFIHSYFEFLYNFFILKMVHRLNFFILASNIPKNWPTQMFKSPMMHNETNTIEKRWLIALGCIYN